MWQGRHCGRSGNMTFADRQRASGLGHPVQRMRTCRLKDWCTSISALIDLLRLSNCAFAAKLPQKGLLFGSPLTQLRQRVMNGGTEIFDQIVLVALESRARQTSDCRSIDNETVQKAKIISA